MKITVFTGNQPRHLSLIDDLSRIADAVFSIQECHTVFPGKVAGFIKKTDVMQSYFSRVISAEEEVFGGIRFSPSNVRNLSLQGGDLNNVSMECLAPALQSDVYIVFGASYIKGPLVDFLVENKAVNIHMGISPYYRGSSCNFWALYDNNPELVGATLHRLSRGLDSGGILFHALPTPGPVDPFVLGMRAVMSAHKALVESIRSNCLFSLEPIIQDKQMQIRYSRNSDFTDDVAKDYLARNLTANVIDEMLTQSPQRKLVRLRRI